MSLDVCAITHVVDWVQQVFILVLIIFVYQIWYRIKPKGWWTVIIKMSRCVQTLECCISVHLFGVCACFQREKGFCEIDLIRLTARNANPLSKHLWFLRYVWLHTSIQWIHATPVIKTSECFPYHYLTRHNKSSGLTWQKYITVVQ